MKPQGPEIVFELRYVELPAAGGLAGALERGVNLALRAGEALCIVNAPRSCASSLADVLCGVRAPVVGHARFRGGDWQGIGPVACARLQSTLRRSFATPTWLGYLPTDEEILLLDRYHTARPDEQRRAEAQSWCRHFGLPGLPTDRPGRLALIDQHRASLARAFIGAPAGLVIEQPVGGEATRLAEPLGTAITAALARRAAVVVISTLADAGMPGLPAVDYRELVASNPPG
jgi:phospholipid/cholesterol/gamma-HCH transport system ATP-binding protein